MSTFRAFPAAMVVALLSGAIIGGSASAAFAAVNYGAYSPVTVSGIDYKARTWVQDTPSSGGVTVVRVTTGGSPGGYMGASANVRNTSGAICSSSGAGYNTSGVNLYTRSTSRGSCGAGSHRTYGNAYYYQVSTGNYLQNTPNASPYITFP